MKAVWTPEAEQGRDVIWIPIAAVSPHDAARMDDCSATPPRHWLISRCLASPTRLQARVS